MSTLCLVIYERNPHENPARVITCPPDMDESEFRMWAKKDFFNCFNYGASEADLDRDHSKWDDSNSSGILVFRDGSELVYEVVYATVLGECS